MRKKIDRRHQADAVRVAGRGAAAAAVITIPRMSTAAELYSKGNFARLVPVLHEISRHTNLATLLKHDYSPLSVLKKALRQWFLEMLPESIEKALDFELDFITEAENYDGDGLEFGAEEGDYVMLFRLGAPFAEDFTINDAVKRYEARYPGLGQKILRKLETATPFCLGTPKHFLEIVRDYCWGGYETETEYVDDLAEGEEEEYREEARQAYLDDIYATKADFDRNFEPWMLNPDDTVFQGTIPAELAELFRLPDRKYRFADYPACNATLPGILVWKNEMLYECFDDIYNRTANDGLDIVLNGLYWTLKQYRSNFAETFQEVENAVRSLGTLLLLLNRLHLEEEHHEHLDSE